MPKRGDLFQDELKRVRAEAAKMQKDLEALQEKQRKAPSTELRYQIQEAKNRLAPLQNEEGELQRAISRQAGGRQFTVEP
jgi:Skp family chaperone for outer membrane proteins